MQVEILSGLDKLHGIESEWLDLWRQCPTATPFQSPQWLIPWTKHLFGGGDIRVLAMCEQGRLIGLAPLFIWGIEKKTVSFLGAGISDYGDVLFAPGREPECVGAVWNFLNGEKANWDVLDLQELRPESLMLAGATTEICSVCPILDLATYPDAMDDKHRTDVRRGRNKLLKAGEVRATVSNEVSFPADFDNFVRLHNKRWESLDPILQCFHRDAAAGFLHEGALRLSLLWLEGEAIAGIYGFACGDTFYCYLSGFDSEKAYLSPGAYLLGSVIEAAQKEGLARVDFLRKTERYKYLWGARDRVNWRITGTGGLRKFPG